MATATSSLLSSVESMASTGSATTINSKGSATGSSNGRQRRYARSTTVSVAQLLHDSCNSILQRFRRNPSEKPGVSANTTTTTTATCSTSLSSPEKRRSSTNLRSNNELSPVATTITEETAKYQSPTTTLANKIEVNNNNINKNKSSDTETETSSSQEKAITRKKSSEMSATPSRNGTASEYHRSDTTSSLLGKLRYGDLSSPVSSYYKPLLRTFTKRFDSPKLNDNENVDRDKTPVFSATGVDPKNIKTSNSTSTISRLESKYSDILDRVHKRKQKEKELDRDKTLEADRGAKSILSSGLTKSKTSAVINNHQQKERTPFALRDKKKKYGLYNIDLGLSDTVSKPVDSTLGILSPYSSPYSALYSRHNNKTRDDYLDSVVADSSRQRPIKAYHRRDSSTEKKLTAINLFDIEFEHRPRATTHRNYGERKKHGPSKSKTQQFFESEDAFSPLPDEELTEREKRRKEIQSIMMKYSQVDDTAPRSTATTSNNTNNHYYSNHSNNNYSETDVIPPKSLYDSHKNDFNNNLDNSSDHLNYGNHYIADHYHIRSPDLGGGLQKSKTSANVAKQFKIVKSPSNHQLQTALVPLVMPGKPYHTGRRTREQPPRHHLLPFSTFVRQIAFRS